MVLPCMQCYQIMIIKFLCKVKYRNTNALVNIQNNVTLSVNRFPVVVPIIVLNLLTATEVKFYQARLSLFYD